MYIKLWTAIFFIVFMCELNQQSQAASTSVTNNDVPVVESIATSFDYDYLPEARGHQKRKGSQQSLKLSKSSKYRKSSSQSSSLNSKAASPGESMSTTQRPIIRVWNNIIRNVRPAFSFRNLTNPLANFFNDGTPNFIETRPVLDYHTAIDDLAPEQERPTTNKRKRKNQKQRQRRPQHSSFDYEGNADDYYKLSASRLQSPVFIYDANTNSYYSMQGYSAIQSPFGTYYVPQNGDATSPNNNDNDVLDDDYEFNETDFPYLEAKALTILSPLKLRNVGKVPLIQKVNRAVTSDKNNGETEFADLSESMRNVLGTYMRDDRLNRQRQRTSGRHSVQLHSKSTPRQHSRYRWLHAW